MNYLKKMSKSLFVLILGMMILFQSQPAHAAEIKIFEKSGYSVEEFNKMLANTKLEKKGQYFKNVEDKYNINGVFAISVASYESAFESRKINSSNNLFGMMRKGRLIKYADVSENIMAFGNLMNKKTYKNKNISSIAKIYCPTNSKKWVSNINSKYNKFINKL